MALGARRSQHITKVLISSSSVVAAALTSCTVLIEQFLLSFTHRNKVDLELNKNKCGERCRRGGVASLFTEICCLAAQISAL